VQVVRFLRFKVDRTVVAVVFWDDIAVSKVRGRCRVISEGGMGASLPDQLYIGDIVRLEMPAVPSIYAAVRNAGGTEHGLEFLYSQDGRRQAIRKLCGLTT